MLASKLKSFEAEASLKTGSTPAEAMRWIVQYGFTNHLSNVPRIDQFTTLLSIAQTNQSFYSSLFSN